MSPSSSISTMVVSDAIARHQTRRFNRHEASKWLRSIMGAYWKQRGEMRVWNPTTAALRVALHHSATPQGVKNHVYNMLLVRRERSRRRRHGHSH